MKFIKWITRLFRSPYRDLKLSIEITQKLKQAVDSKVAIFITQLIPGNVDDHARAELVLILDRVLKVLNLTTETMNEMARSKDGRRVLFSSVAGQIYHELTGVDLESAIAQTQITYSGMNAKVPSDNSSDNGQEQYGR